MKKVHILLLLVVLVWGACSKTKTALRVGTWRAVMASPGGELPFGLDIQKNADSLTYSVYVLNGDERLAMDTARIENDSLRIPMGIFESEIVAKIGDSTLTGYWKKRRKENQYVQMNLSATFGNHTSRFANVKTPTQTVAPKYTTTFYTDKDTTEAVGLFRQKGTELQGTFLTTTGDYRYLAGNVSGDSLMLSCFDGSHVFLFKAKVSGTTLNGVFWSSLASKENWTATANPKAALPDLKTLTYLKKGDDKLSFTFPDTQGKGVSLTDTMFQNKVVIVQILGTWCPNCMDESRFLAPWYAKNRNRGVEIIGLAYEKSKVLSESAPKIERMKQRFGISYPVLLAGLNNKDSASATLPMLNKVLGFPTTIFIDKKGKVREIHTGFSGPGTGTYYDEFVEDFDRLIDKLVAEK